MAVMQDSCLVATFAMARMTQDRGESCRSFASRLRGVARTCDFVETCPHCSHQVDCSDSRVSDQLCIGVADQEIKRDLLEEITKRLTVEQVLHFVEKKTLGKRAATALKTPPTPSASALDDEDMDHVSNHKKLHKHTNPKATLKATPRATPKPIVHRPLTTTPPNTDKGACSFCGRLGHGTAARTAVRRVQCPAFGKTCSTCGHPNHYAQLCWQTMKLEHAVEETVSDMTEGTLPHHTWSPNSRKLTQKQSPPQPTLKVRVTTCKADYSVHGHMLRTEGSSPSTTALADTSCQSCLAGTKLLKELHLEKRDLIPSTHTMKSASGNQIPIWGAILARITTAGKETRQMLYVSPVANKLYLSLSSCKDLGLVQGSFPGNQVTATIRNNPTMTHQAGAPTGEQAAKVTRYRPATPIAPINPTNPTKSCSCPSRSQPPAWPTSLPFPATEANRQRMEEYLLNLYSSSLFNTCEHQTLPMMTGPPLALLIDPNANPNLATTQYQSLYTGKKKSSEAWTETSPWGCWKKSPWGPQ